MKTMIEPNINPVTARLRDAYRTAAREIFRGLVSNEAIDEILPYVDQLATNAGLQGVFLGVKISHAYLGNASNDKAKIELLRNLALRLSPDIDGVYGNQVQQYWLREAEDGLLLGKSCIDEKVGVLVRASLFSRATIALRAQGLMR